MTYFLSFCSVLTNIDTQEVVNCLEKSTGQCTLLPTPNFQADRALPSLTGYNLLHIHAMTRRLCSAGLYIYTL